MNPAGVVQSFAKHLRREQPYERLPTDEIPAQVQNVKDARVYVFGESDVAEEEVNNDETLSLRDRGKKKKQTPKEESSEVLVDREISEGDTLRSLALKYGCPVSTNMFSAMSVLLLVIRRFLELFQVVPWKQ